MTRSIVLVLLVAMTALGTEETTSPTVASDQTSVVTFNKDVLPILQDNCQSCHRPSGIAPMSLMTYENARPWAKAIKTKVVTKEMPPWFAETHSRDLRNAPKLTDANIKTLVAWADTGAPEGAISDKPASAPQWKEGWRIQPDVIVAMPQAYKVSAKGIGEVKTFIIPSPFKEDTWVSSIEIRPGDASVVHHAIVQVPETQTRVSAAIAFSALSPAGVASDAVKNAVFVSPAIANRVIVDNRVGGSGYSDALSRLQEGLTGHGAFMTMEAVYAPGTQPLDFRYANAAKLIPGGQPIRLEVHYTPNGKETTDRTMVGFTLEKAPAERRFVIMAPEHLVDIRKPIPANAENFETVGELTFNRDVELAWFMPHMHLRGKDMTFRLVYPNGKEETVLKTGFNFHWQLGYELEKPIGVPKGTRMIVTAHHDNSANNPNNPTPGQAVAWGEMTSQEMMLPWFGVIVDDRDAKPETIATYRPGDMDGPFPMLRQEITRGITREITTK